MSPGSQRQESAEARLLAAGFTRRLESRVRPARSGRYPERRHRRARGRRDQATHLAWPGVHPDALVGFKAPSEDELDRMLARLPLAGRHPCQGGPSLAQLLAEKLKPVLRAESVRR